MEIWNEFETDFENLSNLSTYFAPISKAGSFKSIKKLLWRMDANRRRLIRDYILHNRQIDRLLTSLNRLSQRQALLRESEASQYRSTSRILQIQQLILQDKAVISRALEAIAPILPLDICDLIAASIAGKLQPHSLHAATRLKRKFCCCKSLWLTCDICRMSGGLPTPLLQAFRAARTRAEDSNVAKQLEELAAKEL